MSVHPEHESVRGKRARGSRRGVCPPLALSALGLAAAQLCGVWAGLTLPGAAWAGPKGGKVVAGQAQIASGNVQTTVVQSTARAVIDWTSFDVRSFETVRFVQPSSSAATAWTVTESMSAPPSSACRPRAPWSSTRPSPPSSMS